MTTELFETNDCEDFSPYDDKALRSISTDALKRYIARTENTLSSIREHLNHDYDYDNYDAVGDADCVSAIGWSRRELFRRELYTAYKGVEIWPEVATCLDCKVKVEDITGEVAIGYGDTGYWTSTRLKLDKFGRLTDIVRIGSTITSRLYDDPEYPPDWVEEDVADETLAENRKWFVSLMKYCARYAGDDQRFVRWSSICSALRWHSKRSKPYQIARDLGAAGQFGFLYSGSAIKRWPHLAVSDGGPVLTCPAEDSIEHLPYGLDWSILYRLLHEYESKFNIRESQEEWNRLFDNIVCKDLNLLANSERQWLRSEFEKRTRYATREESGAIAIKLNLERKQEIPQELPF